MAAAAEVQRCKGTTRWFDKPKGYGFISPDDGSPDIFVHYTSIVCEGDIQMLFEGDVVEFSIILAEDGRTKAVDVTQPGGEKFAKVYRTTENGSSVEPKDNRGRRSSVPKCFNCQKPGHPSRECKEPGNCFNCRKPGHMAKDCTAPKQEKPLSAPKPQECFTCKGTGHFARECPNKKVFDGCCFACGQSGHMKADCPNPRPAKGAGGVGGGDRKCFQCEKKGHLARDCPQAKKSSS